MDDEELTDLLKELVSAAVTLSENVEVIAGVLTRAEEKLEEE